MPNILKILCPVDFSDASKAALSLAVLVAERFDAVIELLHISEPSPYDTASDVLAAADHPDLDLRLEELIDEVAPGQRARIEPIVALGYAAPSIIGRAEDGDFDLVVMGTAGRTGVAHLIMGSVAEKVVRTAPCPVLTTHARSGPGSAAR